jgi:hypothetical protein
MSCNFYFIFQFFCPKSIFLESFKCSIIPMDLVGFLLGCPSKKMISTTLNIIFHIYLGRFIGDSTYIIQILN